MTRSPLEKGQHTPGPWRVVRHNADHPGLGWILESGTNIVLGRVCDSVEEIDPYTHIPIRSEESDANARLISAAPDLLVACEVALNDRMYKDWPQVADLLKAAIAKARGE